MCGIIGYTGARDASEVLLDGLSKLEYRGYDSAGISLFLEDGVHTIKTKGRLQKLSQKLNEIGPLPSVCGIGHTRWATHGEPSDINSHPHQMGKVTVVHNGIIENYIQLKEMLSNSGYHFQTQTDTETVCALMDFQYDGDPVKTIRDSLLALRGAYALGILFSDHPGVLYATRKDSPLILGVGEGENFIASDIPAILKYTRHYILLEENEIAEVTKEKITVYDVAGNVVEKTIQTATWDLSAAEKEGYAHFMLKEIHEQPQALLNTLSPRLQNSLPDFSDEGITAQMLKQYQHIQIVACGTAMYAGTVGKYLIEHIARVSVDVDVASEFRYRNPVLPPRTLVIIISQSGETADSLAALRLAKQMGLPTLAIVNVVASSIAREADHVLYTWAGPEIAVASTKAYYVQVAMMYLLAIALGRSQERLDVPTAETYVAQLRQISVHAKNLLAHSEQIQYCASLYQNARSLFFIGRGLDWALSMEGSLKLKEISYIHSEAYAAGELKHGTISLITDGTPVVAIATQDALLEKMISNVREVQSRGAKVLLLCKEGTVIPKDLADQVIFLPRLPDLFMPLLSIIELQLFAYYTAVLRGCDVDRPRNLAKSVTVE